MSNEEKIEVIIPIEELPKKDNAFLAWFKNLGLKFKLFFVALFGIIGTVIFFIANKSMNSKDILKLELKKVRKEIEIEVAEKGINKNNEKIEILKARAAQIKEEIIEITKVETGREPTEEELDNFFDSRGF